MSCLSLPSVTMLQINKQNKKWDAKAHIENGKRRNTVIKTLVNIKTRSIRRGDGVNLQPFFQFYKTYVDAIQKFFHITYTPLYPKSPGSAGRTVSLSN